MTASEEKDVLAGQAVYSKTTLTLYDFVVLGISNRLVWRCPTARLLDFYNTHISANHLDVGVGTGFYLDRCSWPDQPRIVLVDLNPNSLEVTAQRIKRHHPKRYRRNILAPLHLEEEGFHSIGLNYLLHCLPGDIHSKGMVFDHINDYLQPGGTVFGSTLLQGGVPRSGLARRLMQVYNKKGIFCNVNDDLEGLTETLASRFGEISVEAVGCVALFWARK
jgi:SAM-dependent methyltransferase